MPAIQRGRSALRRSSLSIPTQLALREGVLTNESTFFDYGCGYGDDLKRLQAQGIRAQGWDPVHRPNEPHLRSDIVNIGYVVNVIENYEERVSALRTAWSLTNHVLVVAARTVHERVLGSAFRDGTVTSANTFHKLFEQIELRDWISAVLDANPVAVAPGIFFVFRDPRDREALLANRSRRAAQKARFTKSTNLYEANRELIDRLIEFFLERGRLPQQAETELDGPVINGLGSWRRAQSVVKGLLEPEQYELAHDSGLEDLTVYLALTSVSGWPKLSEQPASTVGDVRAFFGSYRKAKEAAQASIQALADPVVRQTLADASGVGKRTRSALYVHSSAVPELTPSLRIYAGFADLLLGDASFANVLKLGLLEPKISALAYEEFEEDPHPRLLAATTIDLSKMAIRDRTYRDSNNPPILHRKELLVAIHHPLHDKFARLTAAEEKHGLLESDQPIGNLLEWENHLREHGLKHRGHQLVSAK